ncbi:MAG: hypothetical protein ACI959_001376 [Limisphaerales bacterium]|jgi:hypothetical protein
MTLLKKIITGSLLALLPFTAAFAGNPDRIGEAGASEILINPWARSSGWNGINVANVTGMESMRTNVAGLAFTEKTEINFTRTLYLEGSDVNISAFGVAQKVGDGAIGISIVTFSLGDVPETTTAFPEGTGATFSPTVSNIALSYSRNFADYLAAGITVRGISQSMNKLNAFGLALDVGIVYTTGNEAHPERMKFGIALKNIGPPMRFSGDGLAFASFSPDGSFNSTVDQPAQDFELPSLLTIGVSYDLFFGQNSRLTGAAQFQSNSFYKDFYGAGLEYGFKVNGQERFQVRVAYRYEDGLLDSEIRTSAHTGLSGGFSFEQPFKQDGPRIGIDYSYRTSDPYNGSHAVGVRLSL